MNNPEAEQTYWGGHAHEKSMAQDCELRLFQVAIGGRMKLDTIWRR